jgi:hypothetical protein
MKKMQKNRKEFCCSDEKAYHCKEYQINISYTCVFSQVILLSLSKHVKPLKDKSP